MERTLTLVALLVIALFSQSKLVAQQITFGSDGWGVGIGGPAYPYGPNPYGNPYGFGYGYGGPYRQPGSSFYYQRHGNHSHWGVLLDLNEPAYQTYRPSYAPTRARQRTAEQPRDRSSQKDELSRPPVPTSAELARMNWKQLRQMLTYASREFDMDLLRLKNGPKWKTHLMTGTMSDLVSDHENIPPGREARQQLTDIAGRYDKALANDKFRALTRQWGFRTIHVALSEFLKPTETRQRTQLELRSRDLDHSLARWKAGHTWQKYFALPRPLADGEKDLASLEKLLAKFDSVSKNPKFEKIAKLSEFKATHQTLGEFVASLVPPPEELPEPKSPSTTKRNF